jgi:hypothetical protein
VLPIELNDLGFQDVPNMLAAETAAVLFFYALNHETVATEFEHVI